MSNKICDDIEKNDFLQSFLVDNNKSDPVVSKNNLPLCYSKQIAYLTEGLELLSTELQSQVRDQHGALLTQASHAGKLENAIDIVFDHVQKIQNAGEKIRNQITIPYNVLKTQINVLERLHHASHILRQAGRFLNLYKQLQTTTDIIQQASIIYELEPLIETKELENIFFIKDDITVVLSIKQKICSVARIDLNNGLVNGIESKIENGLQILSKLHQLSSSIDEWLETFINDIKQSIKECFSGNDISSNSQKLLSSSSKTTPKAPGKSPTLTTSQNFRQKLWSSIEWLFNEEIYSLCRQVMLLQKCIAKLDLNETCKFNSSVQNKFWNDLEKLLEVSFRKCPMHIAQCLQQSLPKLLAAAKGLENKVENGLIFDSNVFKSLEAGYLEKCGNSFKGSLSSNECPTQDAVDILVRSVSIELSAAMVDENLCLLVAGVFSAVNEDFWNKSKAYIKLGTDSLQVLDIPNAAQQQNTQIANTIFYHKSLVKRMVINLGKSFEESNSAQKIIEGLGIGETLIISILEQLTDSITATLNIILLSMHREPGLNTTIITTTNPSLYIKEFQDVLQRTWSSHITSFNDSSSIEKCGKNVAKKCIELFVQNLAILRPLSTAGRNRLKSDCLHLENALKLICKDLSSLGKHYRMLRTISVMIVLKPEEIMQQSDELDGPMPPYLILYLIFGYAGSDLSSPHSAAGWSNDKLLQWLEIHPLERERLELVSGAVQKYKSLVRQKNIAQYDSVYPLITNYLEKALLYFK